VPGSGLSRPRNEQHQPDSRQSAAGRPWIGPSVLRNVDRRAQPAVRQRLVVEFPLGKDVGNVRRSLADMRVSYPVAMDNDYAIWRAFGNHYWPALYFADAQGRIRHHVRLAARRVPDRFMKETPGRAG
jgi:hypothetical protein